MGLSSITSKAIDTAQVAISPSSVGGALGGHSVVQNNEASDIARAAAVQYHDIEGDERVFTKTTTLARRQKRIKSKFAKRADGDDDLDDPDVDEATR